MRKKLIAGILIIVLSVSCTGLSASASELGDTIAAMQQEEELTKETISNLEKQTKETQDAIKELQGQKEQTQGNVTNLVNQSHALQSTINGYSDKLTTLSQEISATEAAMAEVSAEIVQLDNELNDALLEEQTRYDLLKKRLQSTYEHGGSDGLVRILLESGTMQEFLTKFEYLNAIVEYDKTKITELKALQADIQAKKESVEEKEFQLDQYQSELDNKHIQLTELTNTVKGQLDSTRSSLSSEKNKLENYDQQLSDLDNKMKALESQTAAAQAKLAQQIAERLALTREDTSGSYDANDTELAWLAATIQAEAGGESYTGKLAVGSVIMNRVKSSAFPNTIIGVITQNMQFASYRSGKVELIISNGPNSTCIKAAQEVLAGSRVGDYLFFMTQYWADYYRIVDYTMIGNHAFFYRWATKPAETVQETTTEVQEQVPAETAQETTTEVQEQVPAETVQETTTEVQEQVPAEPAPDENPEPTEHTPAE